MTKGYTEILLEHTGAIFYAILRKHDGTSHSLLYTEISTLSRTRHEHFDRLWKMRTTFVKFSDSCAKRYGLTEYISVNKILLIFKGRIIFRQYIGKEQERFGTKV